MPQPPPTDIGDDSIILSAFSGLKNTVTMERLSPDELAQAVNLDLDDKGQPFRRRGFAQVASGSWHSLFNTEGGKVLGVHDDTLGIVNPDYSFSSLGATINGSPYGSEPPLAYIQVGHDIYYSGLSSAGVVDEVALTTRAWGQSQNLFLSPVVNPSPTLPAIKIKILGSPPIATILGYYNGRIYLAQGKTLWFTEPYLYDWVDKNRDYYMFEGDITMIGIVTDGIYVGTTEGCWFLEGRAFPLARKRVLDSPVVPGSMSYIPGELANPTPPGGGVETENQVSVMFMTSHGICVGKDGGAAYNLTEDKFFFPGMVSASSLYRRQDGMNQFLVVGDSAGTPMDGARIGDYIDGEIIRGGGLWIDMGDKFRFTDQFTPEWS